MKNTVQQEEMIKLTSGYKDNKKLISCSLKPCFVNNQSYIIPKGQQKDNFNIDFRYYWSIKKESNLFQDYSLKSL